MTGLQVDPREVEEDAKIAGRYTGWDAPGTTWARR